MVRGWRKIATIAVASAAVLMVPGSAWAEGSLSVTGVRQEPGLVEFYLSGTGLQSGSALNPGRITVFAGVTKLDAKAEQLSTASAGRAPKRAVVLVLDTSGSMKDGGAMDAAKSAAKQFLAALPADIQVAVVTAGDPSTVPLATLTPDRSRANSVIDALKAAGETSLYDGIKAAAGIVNAKDFAQRRIVVLSDGADTRSKTSLADATKAVSAIPVDTVAFKTEAATATILADLSAKTGGKSYTAADSAALAAAFGDAAGSFSSLLLVKVKVPPAMAGQEVRLNVTADITSGVISTEVPMTLVPDTRIATDFKEAKLSGLPEGLDLILIGLIFVGLLCLGILVFAPMMGYAERRGRLAQVDQFTATPRKRQAAQADQQSGSVAQAALAISEQLMRQAQAEGRMAKQLDRAGMRMRPHEWLLTRGVLSVVFMFPFALILQQVFAPSLIAGLGSVLGTFVALALAIPLGLAFGWGTTAVYHRRRAAQRITAFRTALPDALQLVVGSLRSGFSLPQAIDAMVKEFPDPISGEFGRALGETRLGVDIEDALERVADRMMSKDLGWAVVAVRVQREVGGNLAEVLATTIATMREREMLRRQVRSLSAEGRMSAMVLLALPVVVVTFMALFRRDYISLLYTTAVGAMIGILAICLMVVGTFWLSRVIKVEV